MGSGRHASDEEFEFDFCFFKKILIIIAVLVVVAGMIFCINSLIHKTNENKTQETSQEIVEQSKYEVLGKIIIDKIDVQQPILDSTENDALEEGVIKLYGDKLNSEGNFCIAGHNYENIFKRLDEMEIGDEFEILDKEENSVKYKITEIYSVEPTELEVLKSEEGKVEITLITCENYSTKRLIVKAEIIE